MPRFSGFRRIFLQEPGRLVGYADTNALVFCAHKWKPKCKHHIVEIRGPCEIFKKIQSLLSSSVNSAYFGEVYYKDPLVKGFPRISYYCDDVNNKGVKKEEESNPGIDICYYKLPKYAYENEVRMCFFVCPEKLAKFKDPHVEVKFFRRFCRIDSENPQKPVLKCQEELDFECWKCKKSKTHYSLSEGIEENNDIEKYWFEVHMRLPLPISNNLRNISHKP